MKKIKLIIFALLSVMVLPMLHSCKKNIENNVSSTIEKNDVETQAKVQYLIAVLGIDSTNIEIEKDFIIVGNDIRFSKSEFWSLYKLPKEENTQARHRKQPYKVTSTTVVGVNVFGNVPSDWVNATNAAINLWNSLGGKITFAGMSSNYYQSGKINVTKGNISNGSIVAQGDFVTSSGNPGGYLVINNLYTGTTLSYMQKVYVMVHEIGHCIGFYHTDSNDGSQIITAISSCNNSTDPTSVFKAGNAVAWNGFSNCDKEAFKSLYP